MTASLDHSASPASGDDWWDLTMAIRSTPRGQEDHQLTPPQAGVMRELAVCAKSSGSLKIRDQYQPSLSALCAWTKYSRSTVIRALHELERKGWITRENRPGKLAKGKTPPRKTHYTLHIPMRLTVVPTEYDIDQAAEMLWKSYGWPVAVCVSAVHQVLNKATERHTRIRNLTQYVRAVVASDPEAYAPTPTPPPVAPLAEPCEHGEPRGPKSCPLCRAENRKSKGAGPRTRESRPPRSHRRDSHAPSRDAGQDRADAGDHPGR